MRYSNSLLSCVSVLSIVLPGLAAPFTQGNLVVTQVGDDVYQMSTSTGADAKPVYLVEISPGDLDGTVVQRIPMPTVAEGSNHRFTMNADMRACILTRSENGLYLVLGGFDAPLGMMAVNESLGTVVNRVIARVDAGGAVDTSMGLTDCYYGDPLDHTNAKNASFRSVATTDGTQFWLTGRDGTGDSSHARVRYASYGSTTSVVLNNSEPKDPRVANIFNGRLYVSTNVSGSGAGQYRGVGTGDNFALPMISLGEVFRRLPGYAAPSGSETISPYDFVMFDLDNNGSLDTLYVADDRIVSSSGGLEKFTFDGSTWTYRYTLSAGLEPSPKQAVRTVTGQVGENGHVILYAITAVDTAGGQLVTVTDTGCPTATTMGCSGADTFNVLQTAPEHAVYRGVRFAPRPCVGAECIGACCTPGFVCTAIEQSACSGTFHGIQTSCSNTQCPLVCPKPFSDADQDGDGDMEDFALFQRCFTGNGNSTIPDPQCKCFDRDKDNDVDAEDFGVFSSCSTRSGVAANPACGD